MVPVYWLAAFVILVGIELATMALTTIWFAGGAFAAFLMSLIGVKIEIQLAAFLIVSFLLLFLTRPFAAGYINKNTVKTNVEGLIGKTAHVTQTIQNELEEGTALLDGKEWTARSLNPDEVIPKGSLVRVEEIQGVKLMVTYVKQETL